MLDIFAGATNKHCQRCYQQATSHIMSMFNTEMICMSCKDKEKRHLINAQGAHTGYRYGVNAPQSISFVCLA
jgi:hypothetical protein